MFATPFIYDDSCPPLCLRTTDPVDLKFVRRAIQGYLHESSRDGRKDPNAILNCGLAAGEAAVFHIRDVNSKRRTASADPALHEWLSFVRESVQHHFQFRFDDRCNASFDRHIQVCLFQTKQMVKQLSVALKHFLSEINLKEKGYTGQLKRVLEDVEKKWTLQPSKSGTM